MLRKCFIDLDGVLVNFLDPAYLLFEQQTGIKPEGNDKQKSDQVCEDSRFWTSPLLNTAWWSTLPKMHDADLILAEVHKYFDLNQVAFLSSAASKPSAYAGKMQWVLNHYPQYKRRLLVGSCKEMCSCSEALLIDDWQKNVDGFKAGGGSAILLPRPWNGGTQNSVEFLSQALTLMMRKEWHQKG